MLPCIKHRQVYLDLTAANISEMYSGWSANNHWLHFVFVALADIPKDTIVLKAVSLPATPKHSFESRKTHTKGRQ